MNEPTSTKPELLHLCTSYFSSPSFSFFTCFTTASSYCTTSTYQPEAAAINQVPAFPALNPWKSSPLANLDEEENVMEVFFSWKENKMKQEEMKEKIREAYNVVLHEM